MKILTCTEVSFSYCPLCRGFESHPGQLFFLFSEKRGSPELCALPLPRYLVEFHTRYDNPLLLEV